MSASVFVVVFGLGFCTNYTQAFLGVPRLYGPSEALSNTIENFRCEVPHPPKNESVLLTLLKRGNDTIWLTESTSLAGEPGIFILIIKPSHEGNLQCEARVQNRSNINPTFSKSHYLKVIVPVKGAVIEVLSHQKEFMEDQPLVLLCKVEAGNNVSYKWLLNNQLILQKNETYSSQLLVIRRTTVADSGRYKCEATNRFNDSEAYTFTSRSPPVLITVKGAVSPPKISYTVVKEDSNNYTAVVICQSTTGTPPITFSLYKQTEFLTSLKTYHRGVAFKVPVLTDQFLGIFHCQADNGVNVTHSQQISIHFVPVGGHVSLHYDYDVGENFAIVGLRLYCKVARGSHPRYQWFHNNTLLKDRGSFYYIFNQAPEQSILVMSVGKSSAGTYHCLVSDSFDNTTAISSKKKYLDKEGTLYS
ncbi:Fc receptor-like protein 5 [Cynoglossus semilaevis]|uniref:Fc receptor-like protein 5 n=1 Tax=Cynoglossus semilaevis TaxID=244447 RepID=UPI0004986750|nr:Fc receptor-like protein 5 [Cynoglossus semilaevis]XP_024917854.1 Fc receptor-like protein 5 [Cynoglossus semilaevis]